MSIVDDEERQLRKAVLSAENTRGSVQLKRIQRKEASVIRGVNPDGSPVEHIPAHIDRQG